MNRYDKEPNPRGGNPSYMRPTENSTKREEERKNERDKRKKITDSQSNSLSSLKKKIQNTNNTGDSNKVHQSRAVLSKAKDKKRTKSQPIDLKKNPENIDTLHSSVSVFTCDSHNHKRANLNLTSTIVSKLSSEMTLSLKISGFHIYIYILSFNNDIIILDEDEISLESDSDSLSDNGGDDVYYDDEAIEGLLILYLY